MEKWLMFVVVFVMVLFGAAFMSTQLNMDLNTALLIGILGQLIQHDVFGPKSKK